MIFLIASKSTDGIAVSLTCSFDIL